MPDPQHPFAAFLSKRGARCECVYCAVETVLRSHQPQCLVDARSPDCDSSCSWADRASSKLGSGPPSTRGPAPALPRARDLHRCDVQSQRYTIVKHTLFWYPDSLTRHGPGYRLYGALCHRCEPGKWTRLPKQTDALSLEVTYGAGVSVSGAASRLARTQLEVWR